ncbi:amino acid ABC transporter ATP-binding protein [Microbacterium sp. 5K110]|jgi:cystine transport system ATP-binding protein|uniref:amino acid ABC transporter ATP-binding protein n=1 Tax=unclassified Microbacterium TaxID=2609290 RepID=UPI0010FD8711|nr:amino acid ABC transporter ATP-binding protein [Microbacterium sp. 5K110]TLF27225.1 amino acid ABC transporter ATP-binding protein [Microbacterium sp. 5K110]
MSHTDDPLTPPPGSVSAPLLRVSGLQKSFGANRVLDGVDLEVGRGEVLVLIGPSGSGKTTVLRCLNGLETADAGRVEFDGGPSIDLAGGASKTERAAMRDRSAMVFQHHNLFPHLTVIQNVIEGPVHAHGVPKAEAIARAEALLERVGLAEKRDAYPFELSGGQQQRVGIVRALALQPDLLLFDEPTSALDPELVGEVLKVLRGLADDGWTMVIVTHELAFAREVADEVLFFDEGVIVERGAPEALFTNPEKERTRRFLDRILRPLD